MALGLLLWLWETVQKLGRGRLLLVLDLDGTLVYPQCASGPGANTLYTQGQWICISYRPHLSEFLAFVTARFDLAVFTASQQDYAEKVLSLLELNVPLYSRDYCTNVGQGYEKDLRVLRRPLSHVLLLDDNALCYRRYPDNGLAITCWSGDLEDKELLRVMTVLASRS